MTKKSLRQALGDWTPDGPPPWQAKATVINAARFVERLLPERCIDCNGEGWQQVAGYDDKRATCPTCHGTGELWDEGLVAVATKEIDSYLTGSNLSRFAAERIARAVLCALTQEVVK